MNSEYYLEGTENILTNYSKRDKSLILKVTSRVKISRLKKVSKKVFNGMGNELDCSIKKAVKGINIVLVFYFKNLPKGFKRPNTIFEICNKDGVYLRFNRRNINKAFNDKGYLTTNVNFIKVKKYCKTHTNMTLHRLIAKTFIPNPNNLLTVNHINCVKTDNKVSNLEWMTNSENSKHAWENNLINKNTISNSVSGEKNSQAKLNKKEVDFIRSSYKIDRTKFISEIATEFNTNINTIEKILSGGNVNLPRYKIRKKIKTSRANTYFNKEVYCCKGNTDSYIRGKYIKHYKYFQTTIVNILNISKATVRDIVTNRSWSK